MAHDVFITYSHVDKAVTDAICAGLEKDGIRCWYAPRDIRAGEEWAAAITKAIKASRVMVLVYTDASNHSKQVLREINQALSHELVLIPFRLTETYPSEGMQYYLSAVHWLDALDEPREKSINMLSRMIQAILKQDAEPVPDMTAGEENDGAHRQEAVRPGEEEAGKKKRFRNRLIGILAAVCVILAGAVLYLAGVFNGPDRKQEPAQTPAVAAAPETETPETRPGETGKAEAEAQTSAPETEAPETQPERSAGAELEGPAYAVAGQDFAMTAFRPGDAGRWNVDVWKDMLDGTDGSLIHAESIADDRYEIRLTGEQTANADRIHIHISASQSSASRDINRELVVVPQWDGSAWIEVTGLNEDGTVPINRLFRYRVHPEDGREFREVRIFDGYGTRADQPDRDGAYERDQSFGDPGTYVLYAAVTYDDWQEGYETNDLRRWYTTEPVTVTVTAGGLFAGRSEISYSGLSSGQATVARGEYVTVRMTDSENATDYNPNFRCDTDREDGNWNFECHYDCIDPENHIFRIWTACMPAGDYRIGVHAFAEDVYAYNTPANDGELRLTVRDDRDTENAPVLLRTGSTEINTGDIVVFSVFAPGAEFIELYYHAGVDGNWKDCTDGEFLIRDTGPYWTSGVYTVQAMAYFPRTDESGNRLTYTDQDGNEQPDYTCRQSAPVTMTVSAPGGRIQAEQARDIPDWLAPGSGITVDAPLPEQASWGTVDIVLRNGDNPGDELAQYHWDSDGRALSAVLTWEELERSGAVPGQILSIWVSFNERGYDPAGGETRIPILDLQDPAASEAVLSFAEPEGSGRIDLPPGASARVRVSPREGRTPAEGETAEIQQARWYSTYHSEDILPEQNWEFSVGFGAPACISIWAEVTYTPWREEWEGQEDPRKWYPTNVLVINAQ